jgi:hypothetical protein
MPFYCLSEFLIAFKFSIWMRVKRGQPELLGAVGRKAGNRHVADHAEFRFLCSHLDTGNPPCRLQVAQQQLQGNGDGRRLWLVLGEWEIRGI